MILVVEICVANLIVWKVTISASEIQWLKMSMGWFTKIDCQVDEVNREEKKFGRTCVRLIARERWFEGSSSQQSKLAIHISAQSVGMSDANVYHSNFQ